MCKSSRTLKTNVSILKAVLVFWLIAITRLVKLIKEEEQEQEDDRGRCMIIQPTQ
jgi:hypothetical protein